ncbi:MAG TPA: YbhB/YbcL family Raf kinase inhibitor-like protein [Candidatus Paceibacterota bacterium]|nr:YbhB/YbcL family Raf kinase inhibitor-like protein [Candidatus Paceibacterota bacterium]
MNIESSAFTSGGIIPKQYTCEGDDINPPLAISDPPAGTASFALIMHDHDAPGGDFAHWLMWNIDASVREILEGTTPAGALEGMSDFGNPGWGGPCPPAGTHSDEFHIYALDRMLDLPAGGTKDELRDAIRDCTLEEASVTGLYTKG